MSEGFQKIILMYNPATYEVADVISTYVYRRGLVQMEYSYSTAVGLFNSVINFGLLVGANALSKRVSEVSLW
jgi:putative aldouronate transport system permease protein